MKKKIDGLGRVVIPKEVRKAVGVELGDILDVISEEGKIVITKAIKASNDWRRTEDVKIDLDQVNLIKSKFLKGTRVECIMMDDALCPIERGTQGTIDHVDDIGNIHVLWDNGSTLALIYKVDKFKVLDKE